MGNFFSKTLKKGKRFLFGEEGKVTQRDPFETFSRFRDLYLGGTFAAEKEIARQRDMRRSDPLFAQALGAAGRARTDVLAGRERIGERLSALRGDLRESATATSGNQVLAALEAARTAGGGRGGLAYSGGAANLAARSARAAAGQQGALLTQGLTRVGELETQAESEVMRNLLGANQLEAGVATRFTEQDAQMRQILLQVLGQMGVTGMGGAIQPIKQPGKKGWLDFITGMTGAAANVATVAAKAAG